MTVDDWVYEAVARAGTGGATIRGVQRDIDERHGEELAIDTIEASLAELERRGRIEPDGERWRRAPGTSKADALRALFGEDAPDESEPERN